MVGSKDGLLAPPTAGDLNRLLEAPRTSISGEACLAPRPPQEAHLEAYMAQGAIRLAQGTASVFGPTSHDSVQTTGTLPQRRPQLRAPNPSSPTHGPPNYRHATSYTPILSPHPHPNPLP